MHNRFQIEGSHVSHETQLEGWGLKRNKQKHKQTQTQTQRARASSGGDDGTGTMDCLVRFRLFIIDELPESAEVQCNVLYPLIYLISFIRDDIDQIYTGMFFPGPKYPRDRIVVLMFS